MEGIDNFVDSAMIHRVKLAVFLEHFQKMQRWILSLIEDVTAPKSGHSHSRISHPKILTQNASIPELLKNLEKKRRHYPAPFFKPGWQKSLRASSAIRKTVEPPPYLCGVVLSERLQFTCIWSGNIPNCVCILISSPIPLPPLR